MKWARHLALSFKKDYSTDVFSILREIFFFNLKPHSKRTLVQECIISGGRIKEGIAAIAKSWKE